MTLEELEKKAGELFALLSKEAKESDPRTQKDYQFITTAALLAIEFISDHKRMVEQIEFLNQGICALVDFKAQEYQNGIIVKIANEIQIQNQEDVEEGIKGAEENLQDKLNKGLEEGAQTDLTKEVAETVEKSADNDSV